MGADTIPALTPEAYINRITSAIYGKLANTSYEDKITEASRNTRGERKQRGT